MGERARAILPSVFSVFLALALCWVFIALTRDTQVASEAYLQMLRGGVGDWGAYLDGGRITLLTRPWGEAAITSCAAAIPPASRRPARTSVRCAFSIMSSPLA